MSRIRKRIKMVYIESTSREYPAGGTAIVFRGLTDRDEPIEIEVQLSCCGYSVVRPIREAMQAEMRDAQYQLHNMKVEANKD